MPKTANARWQARRALAIRRGTWQPFIPAAPVVEHVTRLRATMSVAAIAHAAGLPERTVQGIVWPARTRPMQKVTAPVAAALLAVGRPIDAAPDNALICAVGTIRRIRSLHRMGWPAHYIGERLGISKANVSALCRRQRTVSARRAREVRDLYRELADRVGPSEITMARAIRSGWPTPGAWEDIDNPACKPTGARTVDVGAGGVADEMAVAERVLAVLRRGRRDTQEVIEARRAVLAGIPLRHPSGAVPPSRRDPGPLRPAPHVRTADGAGDGEPVPVHDRPAPPVTARVVDGPAGGEGVGVHEVPVRCADETVGARHDGPPSNGRDHSKDTGGGYA